MSTNPDFRMTVDNLVEAPRRGMLVKGRVEGGVIHEGDVVQVSNGSSGPTVKVGQISLGSKPARQAPPGAQVVMLLVELHPAEIHPGDRLLPGRLEDVVQPPQEEPWVFLPGRIYPLRRLRELFGSLAMLVFISLFWIFPALILVPLLQEIGQTGLKNTLPFLLFFLAWYAIITLITMYLLRNLIRRLHGRRVFQAGNASTTARILRRRVVTHSDKYGDYYTYHLQVEFSPTLARPPLGAQRYELDIAQKLYERLALSESMQVKYATREPRIFIIEGE